jgi:septum formation protein
MREMERPVEEREADGVEGDLWRDSHPIVLASKSLGRRLALQQTGLPFEAHPAEVDERTIEARIVAEGGGPDAVVAALSAAKALEISRRFPNSLVIGADQAASCAGQIFGKPADLAAAKAQLSILSGTAHRLHSGLAIAREGRILRETVGHADLVMRVLTDEFVDCYVARVGDAVLNSAGAYQVEGLGAHLFESISGDHWTILGLPLMQLLAFLREIGAVRG